MAQHRTNTEIVVRPATAWDTETLADFNLAMARETEEIALDVRTVHDGVAGALADASRGLYFVAQIAGDVAGCLLVTKEWSDWRNGELWWVQSVYVMPQRRRQGVFRALYAHVRESARAAGSPGLRLYVEKDNQVAQGTYAALGMKITHYRVMEEMF